MSTVDSAAAAHPLDDPLRFVLEALEAEGALVERAADRAAVLLPRDVAARVGVPEEAHLATYPERKDEIAAGIGSPLLEKLVGEARKTVPAASIRVEVEPPRPAHVRSVAERFALRNGLAEIVQVTLGTRAYLAAAVAHAIEADDRREGMLTVIAAPDGGEPDAALGALLDVTTDDSRVVVSRSKVDVRGAARWIAIRAERAVRLANEGALADIERRQARDRERIADYFAQLGAEARAPRRKTDPAAIQAKLAHLTAERDKKIEDLRSRYATRITARIAALVAAEVPAALVQMKLRRRKAERVITLHIPATVHAADALACEGCSMPAPRPTACDDAVHLLCEACAPVAQGRIACLACKQRG